MRLSRRKKRKLILRQKKSDCKYIKCLGAAIYSGLVVAVPLAGSASSLTVLQDVESDFAVMAGHIENIRALDMAKAYVAETAQQAEQANVNLQEARQALQESVENLQQAQENLAAAEAQAEENKKALEAAKKLRKELTAQAIASQQAVADYLPVWYEAQAELQHKVDVLDAYSYNAPAGAASAGSSGRSSSDIQRAQWIEQAWREAGYDNSHLPEIERRLAELESGAADSTSSNDDAAAEAQDRIDAYWARRDELQEQADEARDEFDAVSEELDQLKEQCRDAEEAEAEARRDVLELETELTQSQNDLKSSQADWETSKDDRQEASKAVYDAMRDRDEALAEHSRAKLALKHFGDGMGISRNLEYYNWQGSQNGHQLYSGSSFYWSHAHGEIGVSTGRVVSHTGLSDGAISGITDTTVSAAYTNKHQEMDVKYGLDINLPTGESRTHANAVVPDGVARFSRLGEGWNVTPRLEVTKHLDKYTDVTWRTGYSFRGSYADSWDDMSSRIKPGNQWSNELEYLHTDDVNEYMLQLQYVHNNQARQSGDINNYDFREGDGITGRAYWRHWCNARDGWGAYTDWSYDQGTSYDGIDMEGSGIHRLYYGGGWYHKFDNRRQLRLLANWMRSDGSSYDPLTKQSYNSGRRFSVSLGYEWRMDDRNSVAVDLEHYVLRQQGEANYHGWGAVLSWNRSF